MTVVKVAEKRQTNDAESDRDKSVIDKGPCKGLGKIDFSGSVSLFLPVGNITRFDLVLISREISDVA